MAKIKFRATQGGGEFTVIPEGTYDFQITKVDTDLVSKKGDPQIKLTLEIANEGDYLGQRIPVFLTVDDSFGWVIKQVADAAGVEYEEVEDGQDENGKPVTVIDLDADNLLLRFVRADVSHYKPPANPTKTYHNVRQFVVSSLQAAADKDVGEEAADGEAPAEDQPAEAAPAGRRRPRPAAAT